MRLWIGKNTWVSRRALRQAASLELDQIRSVAVIKHGALGDMVLTRPMLRTLRDALPQARLTLSVVSHYQAGIPEELVDHVHVAQGNDRKASPGEIFRSFRSLGTHDILFDITASSRSFWITRLNRARMKIGYRHRGLERLLYDVAIPRAEYRFEAETFLEQAHILGFNYDWPLRYGQTVAPLSRQKPYIVYFPTASADYKCWPGERYAQLIDSMSRRWPAYEHILLAGLAPWEQERCRTIAAQLSPRDNVIHQQGDNDTPRLLAGASLVIANDTGIRNLSIALERPTVGVFFYAQYRGLPNCGAQPFGYFPRNQEHAIAFRPDGGVPEVAEVESYAERILNYLQQRPLSAPHHPT
jgi:ADP-heptose:LPS heptosyltransferase